MTHHCPTCGAAVADKIDISGLSDAFSTHQKKIIEALAASHPKPLMMDKLIHAVYWNDRDGGPLMPELTIRTIISKMRPKLKEFGWSLPVNAGGRGALAKYRLERIQS